MITLTLNKKYSDENLFNHLFLYEFAIDKGFLVKNKNLLFLKFLYIYN